MKKYHFFCLALVGLFCSIAVLMSQAVTASVEALPFSPKAVIVIDPGHGGEDGGATSCTGVLESQVNLEVSLRLRDLLGIMGYSTRMIRQTDTAVYTPGTETITAKKISDLKNRVAAVNAVDNALLISIHQNQFSDGKYSGAQVFYAATEGSAALAEALQQSLVQNVNPGSRRQCKKADGVYLMKNIHCTAVLVECGFLSNPEEEALLRTPEYQQKLCCIIAASTAGFLEAREGAV